MAMSDEERRAYEARWDAIRVWLRDKIRERGRPSAMWDDDEDGPLGSDVDESTDQPEKGDTIDG